MEPQAAGVKEREPGLTPGSGPIPAGAGIPGGPGPGCWRPGPAIETAWPVPGRPGDAAVIQALDPLRADEVLARLPDLNARADTGALAGLARALQTLVTFRGRHLALARQAYRAEVRLYPRGSGGGSLDLLREIVDLTRQSATSLRHRGSADD
jgi:hypothetical protein